MSQDKDPQGESTGPKRDKKNDQNRGSGQQRAQNSDNRGNFRSNDRQSDRKRPSDKRSDNKRFDNPRPAKKYGENRNPEGRSRGRYEERGAERGSDRNQRRDDKPWENRGERKPWENRGPRQERSGGDRRDSKPWENRGTRGSERGAERGSDRNQRRDDKPWENRGERKPWENRGERAGDRTSGRSGGDQRGGKPWENRVPRQERSGGDRRDSKPWENRGERKPWENRGTRGNEKSEGGLRRWGATPEKGSHHGPTWESKRNRSDDRNASADRPMYPNRPERPRRKEPALPENLDYALLDKGARVQLKGLTKENADAVAGHMIMASLLIDDDPQLAHEHALAASQRAGRIAVVRETLGITAYVLGDFALALREFRTQRRISGDNSQIALMVDSERGLGRLTQALELAREVPRESLPPSVRAQLAIVLAGVRHELGDDEGSLRELTIPELDPEKAYSFSPELFEAYGVALMNLEREDEAERWFDLSQKAAAALDANLDDSVIVVEEFQKEPIPLDDEEKQTEGE